MGIPSGGSGRQRFWASNTQAVGMTWFAASFLAAMKFPSRTAERNGSGKASRRFL
jgi:hypothetical protein